MASALCVLLVAAAWILWISPIPDVDTAGRDATASNRRDQATASTDISSSGLATGNVTRNLRGLRRSFRPTPTTFGDPTEPGRTIELEGVRIHVSGEPRLVLHENRHQAQAYFVQFRGAIQPAWRERVKRAGGVIHGYIPHDALVIDLSRAAAKQLSLDKEIRWIHPVQAGHKVQPFLRELTAMPPEDLPEFIPVTISAFSAQDVQSLVEQLRTLSITVTTTSRGRRWGWIRAEVPPARIMEIAELDRVQWIEEYVTPEIVNNQAVNGRHMNVTNLWTTHGLTGTGQIIGHADTGLDLGSMSMLHPDLNGRIMAAYDRGRPGRWDDPHGHGTHTAGSIIGNGTASTGTIRGVAWEARLVHQSLLDNSGGLGGLPSDLNELYLQTYTNGARVHSDSWGSSVFGSYSTSSRQSDEFMWDHPDMLLVFAAGNDGYDDNADGVIDADSLGAPATAKNLLTVGAAESDKAPGSGGFSGNTYGGLWFFDYPAAPINSDYVSQSANLTNQGMAAFSSRGPTDDGRIKPDVVAPGTDVLSTRSRAVGAGSGWGVFANGNYNFNGGTSMSTPLVAGAASLVRQYLQQYRLHETPSAALVKGIMMHGARSLYPGQYGTNEFLEIPGQRPNHIEGWGQVDLEGSLFPEQANWFFVDQTEGLSAPGAIHQTLFYAEPGELNVTLNYTDFPASAGSSLKLVNDLDLTLFGPEGLIVIPQHGHDHTNNMEHIRFDVPTAGIYTAHVEAANVPSGPQPFSLIISGNVADQPVIMHKPLSNTYHTNQAYLVDATVLSAAPLASNAVSLFWTESSSTSAFAEVIMTPVTNNMFSGSIPSHPNGSQIHYYITASSGVFTALEPQNAPDTIHSFHVTEPYTLNVHATPADIFSVTPNYGTHTFASGNVVRLTAPAYTNTSSGIRIAIAGWIGTGSVPASGNSNQVDVVLSENSSITWEWVTQHALAQTSTVAGIVSTTTWWNAWSIGSTIEAPAETAHAGTNYGLAGWLVDGLRQPDNQSPAVNPVTGLVMYSPRSASAIYLPALQDGNTNGLPDWWEQFYFGTNGALPSTDSDNDGFTNQKELQDRTNPRDELNIPQPPSITLIPLLDPQLHPAPWPIEAIIVDNHSVSNAMVFWHRNSDPWTSAVMSASSVTNYAGMIGGPGTNGDVITYRIEATDFASLKAAVGPFSFAIEYPTLKAAPSSFGVIHAPDATLTNISITLSNAGLADLDWAIDRALFYDHIESGTGTWTHAGLNDQWHTRTNRRSSGRMSWHFGMGPSGLYADNAHAWLISEPVILPAPARLEFQHWAKMEYDMEQNDDHYWDGSVVEISTNGGFTFDMLVPEGGYPHRITDNPASPFPPDTPCYGETAGWEPAVFDLSDYSGCTVLFRFRFGSDGYVTEEGWYIDDVKVVYQDDSSWDWLTVAAGNAVHPHQTTNIAVWLDTVPLNLAERRRATLVISGNDPELTAPVLVPLELHNASREILVTFSEHGNVTPSGSVLIMEGGTTNFWITGDEFFTAGPLFTNGYPAYDIAPSMRTNFVWSGIFTNGSLHVDFVDKLAAGMVPEWWLLEQGFTNQPLEIEAVTDHDGDGMIAWQEYKSATDPQDAESVAMPVISVVPTNNRVIVSWLSFTNPATAYELQRSLNPPDGFMVVATNLTATPPVNVFTNTTGPSAFEAYRVIANP